MHYGPHLESSSRGVGRGSSSGRQGPSARTAALLAAAGRLPSTLHPTSPLISAVAAQPPVVQPEMTTNLCPEEAVTW